MLFGAVIYFGWNYVEAILIALPLPDPKDLKEKISKFVSSGGAQKKP